MSLPWPCRCLGDKVSSNKWFIILSKGLTEVFKPLCLYLLWGLGAFWSSDITGLQCNLCGGKRTWKWEVMSVGRLGWVGVLGLSEPCPEVIPLSGMRNWTLFDLNQAPFINIHTSASKFIGVCKLFTPDRSGKTSLAQTLLCFYQRSSRDPLICLCQKRQTPHFWDQFNSQQYLCI